MLSSMFECEVKTLKTKEGPCLGVAILAGVGTGIFESVQSACHSFIENGETCLPVEDESKTYSEYHKLYKKLYSDLKDSYKLLAEI